MIKYKSKLGEEIELTVERKRHILAFHPEIAEYFDKFGEVLLSPNEIRVSHTDAKVLLFHKRFGNIGAEKYLRIAVKTNERWFILTAYLTSRLVGEVYEF